MLDFLCDNIAIPSLIFINSEITSNGIVPEVGFIGAGKYQTEYDMFDKHKQICVRIIMPDFLKNATVLRDQSFHGNRTEFLITKVYIE